MQHRWVSLLQQTYQCIDKEWTSRRERQWCRSLNGLKIFHLWPQIPEYYTDSFKVA